MSITKRNDKGSALTYDEMDDNFDAIAPRTSATGSIQIPAGDTSARDGSPSDGYLRYNTSLNSFEGYQNGAWGNLGSGGGGGGGDVNQNAFSILSVSGQASVSADTATDTVEFIAGSNITLTTNSTNDSITIAASGLTQDFAYSSLTGVPSSFPPSGHNQDWSTITNTPTTLAGYGITDGGGGGGGAQGVQGFTGQTGGNGLQGFTGAQGTNGIGLSGNQGIQGPEGGGGGGAGNQGVQGLQGERGLTGFGSQGIQGADGSQGTTGNDGGSGAQGIQGPSAPAGATVQGTQGVQGSLGNDGQPGFQGMQGTDAAGAQGVQGADGPAGFGLQGIQGIQGGPGEEGPEGEGAQGIQGTTGIQGLLGGDGGDGPDGPQGVQGPAGSVQGIQGVTGIGDPGVQGLTGSGTQGLVGDIGPQGVQGTQGLSIQGIQGEAVPGPNGLQGAGGFQGATGTDGVGAQGIQGNEGFQGTQGLIGPIATQGVQGFQGIQSVQGLQGPDNGISASDFSVTTGSPNAGGTLTYSDVTSEFTFEPADLSTLSADLDPAGYAIENTDGAVPMEISYVAGTTTRSTIRVGGTNNSYEDRIDLMVSGASAGTYGISVFADNQGTNRAVIVDELPVQFGQFTTTERNALTAVAGMVLWNTSNQKLEVYTGFAWESLN